VIALAGQIEVPMVASVGELVVELEEAAGVVPAGAIVVVLGVVTTGRLARYKTAPRVALGVLMVL
jgi:hypothetical protein